MFFLLSQGKKCYPYLGNIAVFKDRPSLHSECDIWEVDENLDHGIAIDFTEILNK